ncbi:MAG: sigma-70 family RNA polymerase sigma factor [Saprospiraceae bacterium]|nr:sigma-70 family RNA polymerase sigma factor [Saprospiraceae bacterium]
MKENLHTEQICDTVLWQQFKAGSQEAFNQLVKYHYVHLFRYGVSLGFDREIVKDAIQDTCIYIWERRTSLCDASNIRAYLLFSLRTRLLGESKQTKQEKQFWEHILSNQNVQNSFDADWIETERIQENTYQVEHIISTMPSREKEVIQLRFYEGLDNDSIANIMGITKQGVANLLVRTLKTFRASWREVVSLLLIFNIYEILKIS